MIKLLVGFLFGVIYGAITAVEVPDGLISKAAAMIKMIFLS